MRERGREREKRETERERERREREKKRERCIIYLVYNKNKRVEVTSNHSLYIIYYMAIVNSSSFHQINN